MRATSEVEIRSSAAIRTTTRNGLSPPRGSSPLVPRRRSSGQKNSKTEARLAFPQPLTSTL